MRISDWSSDVCSSDLDPDDRARVAGRGGGEAGLDHIDLQRGERPCHAQLGVLAHREAGRLLAVAQAGDIGRASCRERVRQYVSIWVVTVPLKKNKNYNYTT